MHLTRYTDYSLRVLIYLAVQQEELATIEEIAKAYGISNAHLTKIVHQLGRAGYVETVRGRGGGLRLAQPPEKIRVGEVVRHTEAMPLVECFDPKTSHCRIEPVCDLRAALRDALEAFLRTLDGYTLADLVVRRRKPLARLFTVS
jgi:Rrf2 family transcriptional regulator, nitric oxide-sensitive transcriptional repressor